jgi:hypothetical protein
MYQASKVPAMSPSLTNPFSLKTRNQFDFLDIRYAKQYYDTFLREYTAYYHNERNHQGLDNSISFPR